MPTSGNRFRVKFGLSSEYSLITPDPNVLYFLTDTCKIMLGDKDYSGQSSSVLDYKGHVTSVSSLPTPSTSEGFVFSVGSSESLYYSDGTQWIRFNSSDGFLDDSSDNSVQNKVIKTALDSKLDKVNPLIEQPFITDPTLQGTISMSGQRVESVGTPSSTTDAVNKKYVDDQIATRSTISDLDTRVSKLGDSMSGDLDMSGNRIVSTYDVGSSEDDQYVLVNRKYVDQIDVGDVVVDSSLSTTSENPIQNKVVTGRLLDKLSKLGDSMSGDLDMSGNRITGLIDPLNDDDVATKRYVDESSVGQQSDWNQDDDTMMDYIRNKPDIYPSIQSDWNQDDDTRMDYIRNKPDDLGMKVLVDGEYHEIKLSVVGSTPKIIVEVEED